MSDTSGAIELPIVVSVPGAPVTDPAIGHLVAFLTAAIEADVGDEWRTVDAGSAGPAAFGYAHNPASSSFSDRNLPAIYVWRDGAPDVHQHTLDWDVSVTTVKALWVLPAASDEQARTREPAFNGIVASVRRAIARGRHPSWVLPGDDYYDPDVLGSSLAHHMGYVLLQFRQATRIKLRVDDYGGGPPVEYDAIEMQMRLMERTDYDASVHGFPAIDLQGSVAIGDVPLTFNAYQFHPTLGSLTPVVGGSAGGTAVLLTGTQIGTAALVTFGGAPAASVTAIDDGTVLAITPAHVAGVVSVVLTQSSGASATLVGAFTFV